MFDSCFSEQLGKGKRKVPVDRTITLFNRNLEIDTNTIWNIVIFGLTEKFKKIQSLRKREGKNI